MTMACYGPDSPEHSALNANCSDRLPSFNMTWQGRQGKVFDHHATRSRVIGRTGRYTTTGYLYGDHKRMMRGPLLNTVIHCRTQAKMQLTH